MGHYNTGTHESLLEASSFIETVQNRQGLMVCYPEEIAWRMGYIGREDLLAIIKPLAKNRYGQYLSQIVEEERCNG